MTALTPPDDGPDAGVKSALTPVLPAACEVPA
jgi:hypothetical protein